MKNTRILAIAVAAIAMAACEKERTPENVTQVNPNLVEFTISGGAEAGAIVRSAFGKEYPTIEWKTGDKISVIGSKTGNQPFEAKTSGVSTDFDGLLDLEDEVLYAVYPYDANITIPTAPTSYNEELINVSIPSVQYATDGSFDPNAYVAVAKSTDKKFAFKSIVGFLKFQLEDGENVKSVRIVANNDADDKSTTIATAAAVKFNDNGLPTHGMTSWANSTNTITLIEKDGGNQFKSDTDYFITLRAHTLPTGLQIYVEYDNGTIYKISTSKQIFPTGQARNSIMYMGVFGKSHKFTQVNDLYSLYNMGYDIEVAGTKYNKSTLNLTPVLITEPDREIVDPGLYFIDPSATNVSINRANGFTNLFIIGNDLSKKTEIELGNTVRCGSNSNICFKNVSIGAYAGNMFVHNNTNASITRIAFDGCKISLPVNASGASQSLIFNDDTRSIKECAIYNCDIKVTNNTQSLITGRESYASIDLYNNIFYSETNRETFKLFRADRAVAGSNYVACPVEIANVKIEKNTFINVYPEKNNNYGYFYVNKVTSSYALKNNLFELKDLISISGTYRNFLYCVDNTYPTEKPFDKGYMFAIPVEGNEGQCCIKGWAGQENPGTTYGSKESAFSSFDYTTPIFVKTSARANVGATR